jgi:glycosyltransferase involved in cell wall biosynthesis
LNEEDNIQRCLDSLDFVDEIIFLDSGSTDKTIQIANSFDKLRLEYRKFDTYIKQKNFAISLSKNDWILSLDADEEVSEELKTEILNLKKNNFKDSQGFYIPRLSFYLNTWVRHGGWYPNYQLRLFNRTVGNFQGDLVHERVEVKGKVLKLKNPLKHYSYKSISDHLQFIDKYSELCALEKFKKGKKSGITKAIVKSFYKFISMYFLRLGILDGKVGLIISILGSYYNFLKYIKIYELNQKKEI